MYICVVSCYFTEICVKNTLTIRPSSLKELEQIEESWRKETKDLYENVAQLQEDNRKLKTAALEHEGNTVKFKGKLPLHL